VKKLTKRTNELTEENTDVALETKDKAYVLFYATWCPFSQRFLPIFTEYAKASPDECMSIPIDFKPELCDKYGIEYYPTVLLFKEGKVAKRLDAEPGIGLNKDQLVKFTGES